MEFSQVLKKRYSCRSYTGQQVEEDTIKAVVQTAQRTPSWGNTQPWKVFVAGGEATAKIKQGMLHAFDSGENDQPDIIMPEKFAEDMMNRYRGLGMALFKVLGIGREDKDKRAAHYRNNFNAFEAPCLAYFTIPAGQSAYALYDLGSYVTVFCLAAADAGLSSCILAALARYPQAVRQVLPIGDDQQIAIGVALGYGAEDAPVNQYRSERDPLDQVLSLSGF